jgi:hypothetical protein
MSSSQTLEEWHTMQIAEGTEITSIDTHIRSGRLKVTVATQDQVVA